jgi:hypothetical protein
MRVLAAQGLHSRRQFCGGGMSGGTGRVGGPNAGSSPEGQQPVSEACQVPESAL